MAIISASRRNDIPAFHADWLMRCLQNQTVDVHRRNGAIYNVSLAPQDIDCLVLWTKDIRPMTMLDTSGYSMLDHIAQRGIPFYVQHTLTGYGTQIEPGLTDKIAIIDAMRAIGNTFGSDALVWRYDPLLIHDTVSINDLLQLFERAATLLDGCTTECVISNLDVYGKLTTRLQARHIRALTDHECAWLIPRMLDIAHAHGMSLSACAEPRFHALGIKQAHCIDAQRIERIIGHPIDATKDPTQRAVCGCARSIDIGWYGHCAHNCVYCYAHK